MSIRFEIINIYYTASTEHFQVVHFLFNNLQILINALFPNEIIQNGGWIQIQFQAR